MRTQLSTGAAATGDTDALAPGAKAGPWVIESPLGRGGMGTVYAVTHEAIGKRAALKVMHRALAIDRAEGSAVAAERTLTEARVVNRIGHANIVDIFETGTLADGRLYIVMERLDGHPLGAVAQAGKVLPDRAIAILLQICDALIAAHAAGVVHRDLKLDNVFLIDNAEDPAIPKVKVLDWGIAKEVASDVRQTVDGQLVGTPQYLSPEQARGFDVGPPSDVYSLGVMAYELFLEQLPFEAETAAEIMTMHLRAPPPLPSELWPDIPRALEDLLLRMLSKRPVDRPSMLSVARALEQVLAELAAPRGEAPEPPREPTPEPKPPSEPNPRSGRAWRIFAGAIAFSAATATFGVVRDDARRSAGAAVPPPPATLAVEPAAPAPAEAAPTPSSQPHLETSASRSDEVSMPPPKRVSAATPAPRPAPRRVRAREAPLPAAPREAPRRKRPLDRDGTVDPYS